jgi:GNAT superfamily N-acetyltransferase
VSDFRIRPAQMGDELEIVAMVRELAEYEQAADLAIATPEQFAHALFEDSPTVFAYIAELMDGTVVGFALWFRNFSTWQGKHGIYLEDLYVRPSHRGHGVGQALLATLAAKCESQGYPRFEWWVLDWNDSARKVYEHLGAEPLTEWIPYRLTGDKLVHLANKELKS